MHFIEKKRSNVHTYVIPYPATLLLFVVRIPPEISVRDGQKLRELDSTREEELDAVVSDIVDIDDEEPKSKISEGYSDTNAVVEETSKLSQLWKFLSNAVVEFLDQVTEWLERSSSLYVEIVEELKQQEKNREQQEIEVEREALTADMEEPGSCTSYGSVQVQVEVHSEQGQSLDAHRAATKEEHTIVEPVAISEQPPTTSLHESPFTKTAVPQPKTKSVHFAEGDVNDSIHPSISIEDDEHLADFEEEFSKVAEKYSKRPVRFVKALQNALLAHAEYVIYFLVILNVILNGSVLSLGYASLLFAWGLLCIPWPSKTFWLTMIFFSMLVLVLKYVFQFHNIDYNDENLQSGTGFSVQNVLGVVYYKSSADFFRNASWDMLLLIALLLNRGRLKVSLVLNSSVCVRVYYSSLCMHMCSIFILA